MEYIKEEEKGILDGPKGKRRSKADPSERSFKCGCGKAYLSYPALYTHVKTKHDGKFPDGSNQKKKSKEEEAEIYEAKQSYKVWDDIFAFFKEMEGALDSSKENMVMSNLKQFIDENYPKNVDPNVLDIKTLYEKILELFSQLSKNSEETLTSGIAKINDQLKQKTFVTINEAYALFLIDAAQYLAGTLFKELFIFICLFRKLMIEKSGPIKSSLSKPHNVPGPDQDFANLNDPECTADLANDFILTYLCEQASGHLSQFLKILEITKGVTAYHVVVVKFFCNWLCQKKFCKSYLEINTEQIQKQLRKLCSNCNPR